MKIFKYIFTLIAIVTTINASAQVYPVQVTVATTPPYYNYLSHYGDQNNHLLIVATLTDFNSPPVNVRLRLKIEGSGYTLRTRQDIPVGNVYTLSPGVPVFIQGDELLPLLSEQNLAVVSGSPNLNNLPEGITTICIEVVENGTGGAVLATQNCSSFLLQLMQPPQPFLPVCNSVVDTTSMFQTFQWSQPQNYIPSIGSELNYTFSLYEWIDTTNYNIFQTGQGLVYTAQTTSPIVQVSNFDVAFQKGRKYVWRVRAQLSSNGLPTQMITQNGLSQPCSFYYGKPVTISEALADGLSINLSTQALTTRKGQAIWTVTDATPGQGLSTYSSYIVEYRKKTPEGSSIIYPWSVDTVASLMLPIYQLEPEQTYQVRVAGMSGNYTSERTPISEFTTPLARVYACGESDLPFMPGNYQPLPILHMGDVVLIGQFPLNVTQATSLGTPGRFSGYGEIPHDFLAGAKVKVRFDNLLIDKEYFVREGVANAMTDGSENWLHDQYLDHAFKDTVDGVIETGGFINDTTVFVVVNGDTLTYSFDLPYPIVIYGEGNIAYQFWPDGTITITTWGVAPSNDQLDATKDLFVHFEETTQQYGFDKKNSDLFLDSYEAIVCQNQFIYFVPNKSKAKVGTEPVQAVIHGTIPSFQLSELQFEVAGGITTIPFTQINDSTFGLNLPARDFNYSVYAIYADLKLGKINVKSYEQKTKKLTIVPLVDMAGYSKQQIESGLNNIFQSANVNFEVTVKSQFNNPDYTSSLSFEDPSTSLMEKYTDQMRRLRNLYLIENEIDNDQNLIFIIPGFENSDIDGYMVRGKNLGFVKYQSVNSFDQFIRTLAHELGHGIGGLKHPWEQQENLKATTNNLMDYSNDSKLVYSQWEDLRNSPLVLSMLDSEENGELNSALFELANNDLDLNATDNYYDVIPVLNVDTQENFKIKTFNDQSIIFHFTNEQLAKISSLYIHEENLTVLGMRDGTYWYVCTNQIEKFNYDEETQRYGIVDRPALIFYNPNSPRTMDTIISTENKTYYTFKTIDADITIGANQTLNCVDSLIYVSGYKYNALVRTKIICDAEQAPDISGLVAYYFWIESPNPVPIDNHTTIINQQVAQAFKKNNITLFNTSAFSSYNNSAPMDASMPTIHDQKNIVAAQAIDGANTNVFITQDANELKSVIYYKHENDPTWKSIVRDPVLYFEVIPLGNNQYQKTYIESKKFVDLPENGIHLLATSHYVIKKYKQVDGVTFDRYEIFDFSGNNVTDLFLTNEKNPARRYLVFSNGYRGPGQNWDVSDNIVTSNDRYAYWGNIDDLFIGRMRAEGKTWYIDGSERITTSNHKTMGQFAASMELIGTSPKVPEAPYLYNMYLNWTPNQAGFNERKEEGRIAGRAFLAEIKKDPRSIGVKDTVDIVAHSMGYAYAVGFIEEIKNEVYLGRFYIFAPENACSGGNDWTKFEEVWQYGSNNNPDNEDIANCLTLDGTRDPHWWQDGIAPQCAVLNIESLPQERGGRVYIPKSFPTKNFMDSHYIVNYWWVFSQIQIGTKGYVKSR